MRFELFGYRIEIDKKLESDNNIPKELKDAIETIKKFGLKVTGTEKQKRAAAIATATRQKRVKEKIQNAINILKLENKPITPYNVSKISGVSFVTARKYLQELKL